MIPQDRGDFVAEGDWAGTGGANDKNDRPKADE